MTILKLDSSITGEGSISRLLTRSLADQLAAADPGATIIERDLRRARCHEADGQRRSACARKVSPADSRWSLLRCHIVCFRASSTRRGSPLSLSGRTQAGSEEFRYGAGADLGEEPQRVLDQGLQRLHEARRVPAVDDAVIAADSDRFISLRTSSSPSTTTGILLGPC